MTLISATHPSRQGLGTPAKRRLRYREIHTFMEIVSDGDGLLSLDIVETNPILNARNMTA